MRCHLVFFLVHFITKKKLFYCNMPNWMKKTDIDDNCFIFLCYISKYNNLYINFNDFWVLKKIIPVKWNALDLRNTCYWPIGKQIQSFWMTKVFKIKIYRSFTIICKHFAECVCVCIVYCVSGIWHLKMWLCHGFNQTMTYIKVKRIFFHSCMKWNEDE